MTGNGGPEGGGNGVPDDWLVSPLDNLKTALSNSATFQSITGSNNATEALDRIHLWSCADSATLPRAVLFTSSGRSRNKTSTTGWANSGGMLHMLIDYPTAEANQDDPSAAGSAFASDLQDILNELEAQDGAHLNIIGWEEEMAPMPVDEDSDNGRKSWWTQIGVMVR